jgi:hypothetical protein
LYAKLKELFGFWRNVASVSNAGNVSLSRNKAAIKKIRKPFSILYKYLSINNRSDVVANKPQANKNVPHLRSGWVGLNVATKLPNLRLEEKNLRMAENSDN